MSASSAVLGMIIYDKEGHANLGKIRKLTEKFESECGEDDLIRFWNLSPDMFAIITTDGKLVMINDAWTKVLGWSKTELLTAPMFEFIHPNDIRPTREVIGHMTTNILLRFHNRYRKKSGGYVSLEWSSTQWHNDKCYAVARPIPSVCHACPEAATRFEFELANISYSKDIK